VQHQQSSKKSLKKKKILSDTFVYYVNNTGSYITLTVGSSTEKDLNIISAKIFWSDFCVAKMMLEVLNFLYSGICFVNVKVNVLVHQINLCIKIKLADTCPCTLSDST